jgi:hypothetical protein
MYEVAKSSPTSAVRKIINKTIVFLKLARDQMLQGNQATEYPAKSYVF